MDLRSQQYLKAMGIECWQRREMPGRQTDESAENIEEPVVKAAGDERVWGRLQQTVSICTECALHSSRTQTVFGVGNRQADCMVIGEAPGVDEDAQGEPFVGRAGKLLNAMLLAIGLPREQVYIANVLKCRPPNNRDPRPEEISQCKKYLHRQIQLISPKIILVVGRIAAQSLLQTEESIGRLRGAVHRLPEFDLPLLVTYHPAYLLRKPSEKRKSWQDLKLARTILDKSITA